MRIVNLTPHPITVVDDDGFERTYEPDPSGPARVDSTPGEPIPGGINGMIDLRFAPEWGEVQGLPEPEPESDTIYIVSALVAGRCVGRADVFSPGTGPQDNPIRDDSGRIQAVTRLIQAPQN